MCPSKSAQTSTGRNKILYIDLETYCKQNLSDCGVYRYAADPSFTILLMGYAKEEEPVRFLDLSDLSRKEAHDKISKIINSPNTIKCAHNASFEMTCLKAYGFEINPNEWYDTMAMANYAALPPSLAALTDVFGLGDKGKLNSGKDLIQLFSKPDKNGNRKTKNNTQASNQTLEKNAEDEKSDWDRFIEYNLRDVEAERAIYHKLQGSYKLPKKERAVFALDYEINARGIRVDMNLVNSAADLAKTVSDRDTETLRRLTGCLNPASVLQFKAYLNKELKDKIAPELIPERATKADLENLLQIPELPENVRKAVRLKQSISKAAVKKYNTIQRAVCPDGTVKGMFQYYGTRTGRWAGRLVQLQNLRRNSLPDLAWAREEVKAKEMELLEGGYACFSLATSEILGQLIRTAFIPSPGNKLIIADFSSIEARVIAWLAGEQWRQEVFKENGDIYKSSYSKAFGVPVNDITKDMRQKGKIMELALGFSGGVGAMKRFGADKLGLNDMELQNLVTRWRKTSPKITQLWENLQTAAVKALTEGVRTPLSHEIVVKRCEQRIVEKTKGSTNQALSIQLPSGRKLFYQNASCEDLNGKQQITYFDVEQTSRNWQEIRTYGGKLTENVVQAIARDCLAEAMLRLAGAGYKIVSHIHDEVIIDAPANTDTADIEAIMTQLPAWADAGLYLNVNSHKEDFYCKD